MLEDFGFSGDEFLIGDCREDWLDAQYESRYDGDAGQWDYDPNPYDGTYSEE